MGDPLPEGTVKLTVAVPFGPGAATTFVGAEGGEAAEAAVAGRRSAPAVRQSMTETYPNDRKLSDDKPLLRDITGHPRLFAGAGH
jgi:hypothetical protein